MIRYISGGSAPAGKIQDIIFNATQNSDYAKQQGDYAKEQGDAAKNAVTNINEILQNATQATENANEAANIANEKANLADQKANLAQEKIDSLNELETSLNQAITAAQTAVENANSASTNASNEAQYAQQQGNYAKAQGDYAKQQADAVQGLLNDGPVVSVNGKTGIVNLSVSDLGAETPSGAQEKADAAEMNAKSYADDKFLPIDSYTASDVLVKLKTVDGSGSGLDADTVDGKNFSDIQADAQSRADAALDEAKAYADAKLSTNQSSMISAIIFG